LTGRKGEDPFDWWSLVHFAGGLVLGLLPIGWPWAAGLIVGYELFEGGLRHVKTEEGGLFEYESWPNIGADIVLGLSGYAIMHVAVAPFLPWPWHL
jgi:hypothetical protein